MSADKTPVMAQHAAAKRAYADAVVFFRLGDFYEMFGDDAVLASKLLDLTLTSRNKGKPDEIPMAGVPHHAAHGYVARLLELGHKVAICEQMADPSKVKGIVPREVVKVITPGLLTDRDHLQASSNNYLAVAEIGERTTGLSLLDVSTGEFRAAELSGEAELLAELGRAAPSEVLLGGVAGSEARLGELGASVRALGFKAVRTDPPLTAADVAVALGALVSDAEHLPEAA